MMAEVAASTSASMPAEIAPRDAVEDRWKRLTGVDADNPRDRQSVVAVDRRARRSSGCGVDSRRWTYLSVGAGFSQPTEYAH